MLKSLTPQQVHLSTEIGMTLVMYRRESERARARRERIITSLGLELQSLLKRARAMEILDEANVRAAETLVG